MTAAEILERKADEYRAIAEEHGPISEGGVTADRSPFFSIIETVLREVAAALEAERQDIGRSA